MLEGKISIIIPVFNNEATLDRCILSIREQIYKNIEIIILNDGSTDQSLQIMQKHERLDQRIKVIDKNKTGVAETRNLGLHYATGDYLMFIDGDDYAECYWCYYLLENLLKNRTDLAICNYYSIGEEEKTINTLYLKKGYRRKAFLRKFIKHPSTYYYGVIWNKLYKLDIIKKNEISFENCNFGEDFIFNLEYMKHINRISAIANPLYCYTVSNSASLSKKRKGIIQQIDERVNLYRKYEYFWKEIKAYKIYQLSIHKYALYYYDQMTKMIELWQYDVDDGLITNELRQNYNEYITDMLNNKSEIKEFEYKIFYLLKKIKKSIKVFKYNVRHFGLRTSVYDFFYLEFWGKVKNLRYVLICRENDNTNIKEYIEILEELKKYVNIELKICDIEEIRMQKKTWNLVICVNCSIKDYINKLNTRVLIEKKDYCFERSNIVSLKKFYNERDVVIINDFEQARKINEQANIFDERVFFINEYGKEIKKYIIKKMLNIKE